MKLPATLNCCARSGKFLVVGNSHLTSTHKEEWCCDLFAYTKR